MRTPHFLDPHDDDEAQMSWRRDAACIATLFMLLTWSGGVSAQPKPKPKQTTAQRIIEQVLEAEQQWSKDPKATHAHAKKAIALWERSHSTLQGAALKDAGVAAGRAYNIHGQFIGLQAEEIKLKGSNFKQIQEQLVRRTKLMQESNQAYTQSVMLGQAHGALALSCMSLIAIGRNKELMAYEIAQIPAPAGLDEREQDRFRAELALYVDPLRASAVESYAACVALPNASKDANLNQWQVQASAQCRHRAPQRCEEIKPMAFSEAGDAY